MFWGKAGSSWECLACFSSVSVQTSDHSSPHRREPECTLRFRNRTKCLCCNSITVVFECPMRISWRRLSTLVTSRKALRKSKEYNHAKNSKQKGGGACTQSQKATGVNQVNRTDRKTACRACVMRDVVAWELRSGAVVTWLTCQSPTMASYTGKNYSEVHCWFTHNHFAVASYDCVFLYRKDPPINWNTPTICEQHPKIQHR